MNVFTDYPCDCCSFRLARIAHCFPLFVESLSQAGAKNSSPGEPIFLSCRNYSPRPEQYPKTFLLTYIWTTTLIWSWSFVVKSKASLVFARGIILVTYFLAVIFPDWISSAASNHRGTLGPGFPRQSAYGGGQDQTQRMDQYDRPPGQSRMSCCLRSVPHRPNLKG